MTVGDRLAAEYADRHPASAEWHRRALPLFTARGATHFARVATPFRPYIVRAMGARKWDADDNEYLDYVMGHGALILGHSHPAVVEAIQRQAALGIHYGDSHPLEVEWAERIRALLPSAERIEFFASGQEANLMAIRLSRVHTGRLGVLRFAFNYHGWADELMALGSPGVVADHVKEIPANDVALVERELATGGYAILMLEGGGGRLSGRIPTDPDFSRALPALCRRHGTVMLLDEVVTGFREAPGGWQSVLGIVPDLTALGKAVSGGLASGALAGRAELLEPFNPDRGAGRVVSHGGTWNAVPITCAAGIAACRLYVDGAPQRTAGRMAALLRAKANAAFRQQGIEAKLYGATSVVHVYLGAIDAAGHADPCSPPTADLSHLTDPLRESIYKRLDLHLLHRGIASLRGEAFILSSAHTEADIDQTVTATVDAVTALQKEGALASLPRG